MIILKIVLALIVLVVCFTGLMIGFLMIPKKDIPLALGLFFMVSSVIVFFNLFRLF